MPLFAVRFEDDPAVAAAVRLQHMPDHLAFLERNAALMRAAGPLSDPADAGQAGGLWIVEAPDAARVEMLVREDPFWAAGLRRSVEVHVWRQVFADGRRI